MLDSNEHFIGYTFELLYQIKLNMSNVEVIYASSIPSCAGMADKIIEERRLIDFNNPVLLVAYILNPYLRESAVEAWNNDCDQDDDANDVYDEEEARKKKRLFKYKESFRLVGSRYIRFISHEVGSDSSNSHNFILNKLQKEIHEYLNLVGKKWIAFHKQLIESDPVSPKDAWDIYGVGTLKCFASLILGISIRQSPIECYFSHRTLTVGSRRKRLKTANEEMLTAGKLSQSYLIRNGYLFPDAVMKEENGSSAKLFKRLQSKELSLDDWIYLANVSDNYAAKFADNDTGTLVSFPSFTTNTAVNVDDESLDWDPVEENISDVDIPEVDHSINHPIQPSIKRQKIKKQTTKKKNILNRIKSNSIGNKKKLARKLQRRNKVT